MQHSGDGAHGQENTQVERDISCSKPDEECDVGKQKGRVLELVPGVAGHLRPRRKNRNGTAVSYCIPLRAYEGARNGCEDRADLRAEYVGLVRSLAV